MARPSQTELLAQVSHELRTPINGVLGMTELLFDTPLNEEQREYLDVLQNSAESLLYLLNDILDLARVESDRLELDPIAFGLRHTIDEAMRTFALRASQKEVELAVDVAADAPDSLIGDPGRLRQVLVNLLSNALKFTSHGEIVLSVRPDGDQAGDTMIHFAVSDTGMGIPLEAQVRIFDPFIQADRSTFRHFGGSGLGLSIAKQLVELMGGRIWVESEPGRGSTFHFTSRFKPQKTAPLPQLPRAVLSGQRVLIVEKHATQRRVLGSLLEELGVRAESLDSGELAVERLREAHAASDPFDILICEARAPGVDGFRLVETLTAQRAFESPLTVLLSAVGRRGDAARCRELGVSAYLTKPVGRRDLIRALETALGIRQTDTPPQLITRHTLRDQERRLHILVAEDDATSQHWLLRTLEKRGHTTQVANDGAAAVELATHGYFDLILMDVEMPGMGGLEAAERIRRHEGSGGFGVPILALTAHAMKQDEARCLEAGMNAYLSKPLRAEALFDAIEQAVPGEPTTQTSVDEVKFETIDAGEVIARDELRDRVDDDAALLRELVELFVPTAGERVEEIRTAIAAADHAAVQRLTHALKGSLGNLAAKPAAEAARRVERLAGTSRPEGLEEAGEELAREIERLLPALRELVEKPGAGPD